MAVELLQKHPRGRLRKSAKVWKATERQSAFLRAPEDEVLYGGAVGGGKSDALIIFNLLRRQTIPGSRGLILRRSYPELERTLILRALELLHGTGAKYQAQHHRFVFPNGSIIEFGYAETDADVTKYLSAEYEDISIDELTQFTEYRYLMLQSRLRTTIPGVRCVMRGATNPGDVGHGWVKARFIDPAPPNTPFTDPETGLTRRYVPSTLDDNPHIDKDQYEKRLAALPEDQRRAYRHGDWDVFAGQFFKEFRRQVDGKPWHVIPVQAIPPDWRRWRAIDWGYTNPAAVLWFAQSPEGRIWVYRELYKAGLAARQLAGLILDSDGPEERVRLTLADPALWAKTGHDGISVAQAMSFAGLGLRKSDNDRIAGWERVRYFLAPHKWDDGTESPRLQIMENCTNLIRTLPQLVHDKTKVEDVDTNGEDHAPDALRYGLILPVAPTISSEERRARAERRRRLIAPTVSSITGY